MLRYGRIRLPLAVAFVVAGGCTLHSGSPVPGSASNWMAAQTSGRPAAAKHLYVLEFDAAKAVLEYRLQNGIPAAMPDREIQGLDGPNALTFDAAGNLFILDGRTIKEFAAGAKGHATPIRKLDVPLSLNIGALAVDSNGYIFVGQKSRLNVYSPGASGHAKPIAKITPTGYPSALAIDAGDNLYALGNTQKMHPVLTFKMHLSVYTTPQMPTRIREFCSHWLPNHGIDYGVALDGAGNLFTTHPYFINSAPHGQIDVYAAGDDACPADPLRAIATTNPSLLGPVYLALDGGYLYVYDLDYGNGGVVFTLRSSGSLQTPLSTLYVRNKQGHNVQGIAIGP
jgi:hypothetical protein